MSQCVREEPLPQTELTEPPLEYLDLYSSNSPLNHREHYQYHENYENYEGDESHPMLSGFYHEYGMSDDYCLPLAETNFTENIENFFRGPNFEYLPSPAQDSMNFSEFFRQLENQRDANVAQNACKFLRVYNASQNRYFVGIDLDECALLGSDTNMVLNLGMMSLKFHSFPPPFSTPELQKRYKEQQMAMPRVQQHLEQLGKLVVNPRLIEAFTQITTQLGYVPYVFAYTNKGGLLDLLQECIAEYHHLYKKSRIGACVDNDVSSGNSGHSQSKNIFNFGNGGFTSFLEGSSGIMDYTYLWNSICSENLDLEEVLKTLMARAVAFDSHQLKHKKRQRPHNRDHHLIHEHHANHEHHTSCEHHLNHDHHDHHTIDEQHTNHQHLNNNEEFREEGEVESEEEKHMYGEEFMENKRELENMLMEKIKELRRCIIRLGLSTWAISKCLGLEYNISVFLSHVQYKDLDSVVEKLGVSSLDKVWLYDDQSRNHLHRMIELKYHHNPAMAKKKGVDHEDPKSIHMIQVQPYSAKIVPSEIRVKISRVLNTLIPVPEIFFMAFHKSLLERISVETVHFHKDHLIFHNVHNDPYGKGGCFMMGAKSLAEGVEGEEGEPWCTSVFIKTD
jgi:hypothetical protein